MTRIALIAIALLIASSFAVAQNEPQRQPLVDPQTQPLVKWNALQPLPPGVNVGLKDMQQNGYRFTRFVAKSSAGFQKLALLAPQPNAQVLEDFTATAEVNSSTPGIAIALRVVLPNFIDPRTSKPLTTWIRGQRSNTSGRWETLTVEGTPKTVLQRVMQLRSELKTPEVNAQGAYFNAVGLLLEVHQGKTFVDIRNVDYGPVVSAGKDPLMVNPVSASETSPAAQPRPANQLRIERDRVEQNGKPVFPVIVADHGEPLSFFNDINASLVWVPDVSDSKRINELMKAGHLVLATPPHPEFDPADFSKPLQGLAPLEYAHPLPSAWILGTGITADQLPHLLAWAREVRSADKQLRRPLFADMVESEGVASRQVDAIGISQHAASLLKPFGEARNAAYLRQNTTTQLTLPWEWIQTEIAPGIAQWRTQAGHSPIFIEPEQILQQLFASLSAGTRGIGFWKSRNLSAASANDEETRTAIRLAGLYLQVLEPWLVDGAIDGHIPVKTETSKIRSVRDVVRLPVTRIRYDQTPQGPDAAVIRSGGTSIIVASWWDQQSHYVPSTMSSPVAEMVVSSTETSAAWQMSLTRLSGLRRNRAAGGLKLNLQNFDQHAIMLVTSDQGQRRQLQARIQEVAAEAAKLWSKLAELKLARVRRTVAAIDQQVQAPSGIAPWMQRAADFQTQAADALRRSDYHGCETPARNCLQALRVIQSTYWKQAAGQLTTPTCSPHCASFSTLPEHWSMVNRNVRSQTMGEPLLTSGDFENDRALFDGEWQQIQPHPDQFQTSADVVYDPQGAGQSLRLRSWTADRNEGASKERTSLLIASKAMPVMAGDFVQITGKVRLGPNLRSSGSTPFMIFDDDLGPEFSVVPKLTTSWKPFQLYREVAEAGDLKIWLGLKGTGEVYVDDLNVQRVVRRGAVPATARQESLGKTVPAGFRTPGKSSRPQGAVRSGQSFP